MIWLFAVLVVLALGGIAAVAAGRGAGLADDDDVGTPASETPLDAAGLRSVRFPLAVRGYRMADVDALLDRLAEREAGREAEREGPLEPPTDR